MSDTSDAGGQGVRLLVVDDDPLFRSSLKRMVRLMKYLHVVRVFEAEDGAEALAMLQEEPVELIVLDYHMPRGSGLHWMEQMLSSPGAPAVVVATGQGDESVAVEAMRRGAADYLAKGGMGLAELERALLNAQEVRELRNQLRVREEQLLRAERHRVMIESLGAACHHLGQPATIMLQYLEILRSSEQDPDKLEMIGVCLESAERMRDVLRKLQRVGAYQTTPYAKCESGMVRILEIEDPGG